MRRYFWPMMILLSAVSIAAFARTTSAAVPAASPIDHRERQVSLTLRRAAQYVDVPHISSRPACADVQPPQALTTPDPLLTSSASSGKIKVSFIIGTDGRVHSPLILQSAGVVGDRRVLQTVRTWRYRPATCNGVPTETDGTIEVSSR